MQKNLKVLFNRANLYYEVRPKTQEIDKQIIKFIKQHEGKSGIIYLSQEKKLRNFSEILKTNEIKAAGISCRTR